MLNTLTKKRNEQKKKKGFTLIELIIVIAIIAILIALVVPKFMNVTKDAKIKADIANARTIESAITTARATDSLKFTSGTTVDLKALIQNVPVGKHIEGGTFEATFDEANNGTITVKLIKDSKPTIVLGEDQDDDYKKAVEKN